MDDNFLNKLWAVGGGKGGVGKSITTLMLGVALARQGKKVILIDADLGGSNLNILAGIKYPDFTLSDFIQRKIENIEEAVMDTTVDNLKLICGADDILGMANPKDAQKIRLFNHLKTLEADIILLDLGAGTSYITMDFFLFAPNRILVVSPEVTSIQNAYGFIKSCFFRKLCRAFNKDEQGLEIIKQIINGQGQQKNDSITGLKQALMSLGGQQNEKLDACLEELQMGVVVNMVREDRQINVGRVIQTVVNNYLGLNPEFLGHVSYDAKLGRYINKMQDFISNGNDSTAVMCYYDIASKIMGKAAVINKPVLPAQTGTVKK